MTRRTSARIAGVTFLLYIVAGVAALMLYGGATNAEGTAAKLAGMAAHAPAVRVSVVLTLIAAFSALVLGVTLYGITRDVDHELAMLAMVCRVCEGMMGAASIMATLGQLWLATAAGAGAPDAVAAQALGAFLFKVDGWTPFISATFFAVGSTLFSWLLLRGGTVPAPLARLGVVASVLLVVAVPAQLVGLPGGLMGQLLWLPMLVFEVTLAFWLIIKGVREPVRV